MNAEIYVDVLTEQLRRERAVITAMQHRTGRNPVSNLLLRKPWRAGHRPRWNRPREVWDWVRFAHDCQDPVVGCSCSGGFRFPNDAR